MSCIVFLNIEKSETADLMFMVFSSENSINKMISNLIISRTILFLYHSYFDIHFVYQKNAIIKKFVISVHERFSLGVTNAFSFQFSIFDKAHSFFMLSISIFNLCSFSAISSIFRLMLPCDTGALLYCFPDLAICVKFLCLACVAHWVDVVAEAICLVLSLLNLFRFKRKKNNLCNTCTFDEGVPPYVLYKFSASLMSTLNQNKAHVDMQI